MGTLLPDRHPNRDFFILDVSDASPKDDMASMEHPVFSLSIKPDKRELTYENGKHRLRVIPSGLGLATIMDKDILLYCISKLVHALNEKQEISQWVEMTAHEVMVATNWNTGKRDYKRFEDALTRLRGTTLITDVRTGDQLQTHGFGLIDEFVIDRKDEQGDLSPFGRMTQVRIKVSEWTFRAIQAHEVLTINPQYFRLRRPLERRIYELARKHVGESGPRSVFRIGIGKLQNKVGSNAPAKKFRFFLKEIIREGHIPDYAIQINGDIVEFSSTKLARIKHKGRLALKPETLDRAQAIAAEKGYPLAQLEAEWSEWMSQQEEKPRSPDGAFIGFCKKKPSLRQKQLI
jgi:plasmid replication initiation protein